MASSKTLERPVSRRVLAWNLRRKVVRVWRPWRRMGVVESSVRVRRTGMKRGQCLVMRVS
jgi:hypothetical protein